MPIQALHINIFKGIITMIVFFLLTSATITYGQDQSVAVLDCTETVKGTILDQDSQVPIPFVVVKVKNSEKFAVTDEKGRFKIEGLCETAKTLEITCVGYCRTVCENKLNKANKIFLTKEIHGLNEVTINAKHEHQEGLKTIAHKRIQIDPTASTLDLATAIQQAPGVDITSVGTNVKIPIIHGLYGSRILILNNGIKHGFQNWGSDHAPEIDISSAKNIDIIKGAAGVRFGPEALGGAIIVNGNLLNLRQPFYVNGSSTYETNGKGITGHIGTGIGLKNIAAFVHFKGSKIGDRKAANYNLTNTGKEETSLSTGFRFHKNNFDIKTHYSYLSQNLGMLRAAVAESGQSFQRAITSGTPRIVKPFSYEIDEPNQVISHHFLKIEANYYFDKSTLTFRTGQQLNERKEFDVRRNAERPVLDLSLITRDYQFEWKHPSWNGFEGLAGFQFFSQDNDNNPGTFITPLVPNYNTTRWSSYLTESKAIGKTTLEFGVRYDLENQNIRGKSQGQNFFRDDFDIQNITASIGFMHEFNDHKRWNLSLGTAWRGPNMAELYSFGQHGVRLSYGLLRYNIDQTSFSTAQVAKFEESSVSPEKGFKLISEYHVGDQKNDFIITGYAHYLQNYIFEKPYSIVNSARGPMPTFIYEQTDAFFTGIDFSWKKYYSENINGTLGINYLWSKNISDDVFFIGQPPVKFNYNLESTFSNWLNFADLKISINPSYTFRQFLAPRTVTPQEIFSGEEALTFNSENFDFASPSDGFFLLDMKAELGYKNLILNLIINNTFNTAYRNYLNSYRYFADDLGRNILVGINYRFKKNKQN